MNKIEKSRVAQRFEKANQSYIQHAMMQKKIAAQLMQLIESYSPAKEIENVFEIGCGTGNLSHLFIQKYKYKNLYLNDLYHDVQQHFEIDHLVNWHIGDAEEIHFPKDLDMMISSSAFQWMTDLDSIFKKSKHALKDRGLLCFSTFGKSNLKEIKHLTGRGLDYLNFEEIQNKLLGQGFEILSATEHYDALHFSHPKLVLKHLQATGVTATATQFRWTKQSLEQFFIRYRQFIHTDEYENLVYPLTYHPIYIIARRLP